MNKNNGEEDNSNIYLSYSLPRLIATPIQYCFTAYLWYMYIKEFKWSSLEYGELYWLYTIVQIFSYTTLGYIFNLVIEDRGNSSECRLKTTKWIEIGSIILLSVRTIIWNLLCRARTTARNYLTPYESYPFEKAERDKRIRIIRSMFPDLLNPLPRFNQNQISDPGSIHIIKTLSNSSIPFWPKFRDLIHTCLVRLWNLLCRARTTARNYLTPYERYPAENAERQKRLRIIRSMFPELANPLPQPEPSTDSIPVINTLPIPSLLSKMRSLFKPKSRLRSPYDFPFSPVEFGGVPDLTATWTMVWYKSPDPLIPEVEYKPSLRERFNYFRNRGSYNVAKYDPPVPEMYIPPEPVPVSVSSTSKSTPTSSLPPPIPPIKRAQLHEPIEQLPEPKSIPKPNQGPIPYITPGPPPVDSIPEPEPNVNSSPKTIPISIPVHKPKPTYIASHNIRPMNDHLFSSSPIHLELFLRPIEIIFRAFFSKRFILYTMIVLHGLGMSSFDLCNKALPTYIYPEHIAYDPDADKYDKNNTLRNTLNTISVGVFVGASFFVILLFASVKNFAHSKTAFSNTFFIISIFFFFGQIPILYFFHEKVEGNSNAEDSMGNHHCLELCTDDYLKLACLAIFHATTTFWIFTAGLLANYVSTNIIGEYVSIIGLIVSIIVVGFAFVSWLHIAIVSFISHACRYLFNYGDGQIILVAACIIGQTVTHYIFGPYGYWWNVASIFQFLILIITGIANMIFLIHIYVMLDNILKKKTVNDLKWLMIGIFYAVMSLVTYSAVYMNFNSYYNNEIMEGTRNSSIWSFHHCFPNTYKSISFVFQLANIAAFAVYYLIHSCDACKKRLEYDKILKNEINKTKEDIKSAKENISIVKKDLEYVKKEALGAQLNAAWALTVANEAKEEAKKAQKIAMHALEVAVYALKVSAWAQTVATGALNLASSAKNLALDALNFAINALNFAGNAYRDASWARIFAEDAKRDASYAKMISTDAQIDAKIARLFAEDALKDASQAKTIASSAQIDAKIARLFAEDAQMIAADAQAYTTSAIKFAVDALNHASSAQEDASQAKTIASSAQMIAENAKRDSLWARIFAGDALSYASSAKEDTENAKRDASQAIKVANNAITTANEAKGIVDKIEKARIATERIAKAFSKVERKRIQSLANGFITSSNSFKQKTQDFDDEANKLLTTLGNNQKVSAVLTYFSEATNAFKRAVDILTEPNDGAAKKFQEFTEALQQNTACNMPNLTLSPILFGMVSRIEKLQDAVNDFKDKADIFGDAKNPTPKQFQTMATKFSRTGRVFNSFAQSLNNAAEYFAEFANALPQNSECRQLKDNANGFKFKAKEFADAAKQFETNAFSFCGQSSQITNKADLTKIQGHFNTLPTGTQLPLKFKDAIDALHQSIKSVVI